MKQTTPYHLPSKKPQDKKTHPKCSSENTYGVKGLLYVSLTSKPGIYWLSCWNNTTVKSVATSALFPPPPLSEAFHLAVLCPFNISFYRLSLCFCTDRAMAATSEMCYILSHILQFHQTVSSADLVSSLSFQNFSCLAPECNFWNIYFPFLFHYSQTIG